MSERPPVQHDAHIEASVPPMSDGRQGAREQAMDPGLLAVGALFLVPLGVGIWLGRWWWLALAPAIVFAGGFLFAQTASTTYETHDQYLTDRGLAYLLTFLALVLAFLGALAGTPIGYVRRRRSPAPPNTAGPLNGWE
jgi:hypothetical protein